MTVLGLRRGMRPPSPLVEGVFANETVAEGKG